LVSDKFGTYAKTDDETSSVSRLGRPSARLRAVAFDLDGTLVNTLPAMEMSWNAVLRPVIGRPIPCDEIVRNLGPRAIDIMRSYAPENAETLLTTLSECFLSSALTHAQLYPRIAELIEALVARQLAVGVVTSMRRETAIPLLEHVGLKKHLSVVVTEDDVSRMKPDPEPVLMAANALRVDPGELLMVGDNPTDMHAARAAGAAAGAAVWGFYGRKAAGDADWVFEQPYEVLEVCG
jgi:HAD superfamily hydrolase (TIGR01509 family)